MTGRIVFLCIGILLMPMVLHIVGVPVSEWEVSKLLPMSAPEADADGMEIKRLGSKDGYEYDRITTPDGRVFLCLRYYGDVGSTMQCVQLLLI